MNSEILVTLFQNPESSVSAHITDALRAACIIMTVVTVFAGFASAASAAGGREFKGPNSATAKGPWWSVGEEGGSDGMLVSHLNLPDSSYEEADQALAASSSARVVRTALAEAAGEPPQGEGDTDDSCHVTVTLSQSAARAVTRGGTGAAAAAITAATGVATAGIGAVVVAIVSAASSARWPASRVTPSSHATTSSSGWLPCP